MTYPNPTFDPAWLTAAPRPGEPKQFGAPIVFERPQPVPGPANSDPSAVETAEPTHDEQGDRVIPADLAAKLDSLIMQRAAAKEAVDGAQARLDTVNDQIRELSGGEPLDYEAPNGSRLVVTFPAPTRTFDRTKFEKVNGRIPDEFYKVGKPGAGRVTVYAPKGDENR